MKNFKILASFVASIWLASATAESASVNAELAFVRTMTPAKTSEQTRTAADALRRAKQKGASPEELQDYIPLVDPALYGELGVPEPRKSR